MAFPKTETELAEMGYKFNGRGKCRGADCGQEIAWYITPDGKRMPLDEGTLEVHWFTCPNAEDFRGG